MYIIGGKFYCRCFFTANTMTPHERNHNETNPLVQHRLIVVAGIKNTVCTTRPCTEYLSFVQI